MSALFPVRLAGLMVVATVLLGACATPKATYRSNYDKSADLGAYRTYAFVPNPGTYRAGYSTLLTQRFENAIRREMDARGYRYSDSDPDLLVNFNANAQEKVDLRSSSTPASGGYYYGYYGYRQGLYMPSAAYTTGVETVRYKVGTANIDVADARKKLLLWEGIAEGKLTREVMENPEAAINAVVTQLFAQFPGRAGDPRPVNGSAEG